MSVIKSIFLGIMVFFVITASVEILVMFGFLTKIGVEVLERHLNLPIEYYRSTPVLQTGLNKHEEK